MGAALALAFFSADAQQTITQYLSGTDKDHTVAWDFYCTTGRRSGKWDKIPVPSNWELQGFGTYNYYTDKENPEETGIYRHVFTVDAARRGKRVFIVFEGSMTDTEVKINGRSAGPVHQGGFYRFKYDITDLLRAGANLLEAKVSKRSANASVNMAERKADFWEFGGIFRPVYLEIVPQTHIDRMAIDAKADGSIRLDVFLAGLHPGDRAIAVVEKLDGQKIGDTLTTNWNGAWIKAEPGQDMSDSGGRVKGPEPVTFRGRIDGIVPWNPEFPQLYDLVVSVVDEHGRPIHTVVQRFGFRTMELRRQDGIYVNGRRVIFKGVCRHSEWPESGRTLSKAISILDVNLMKDMNMNAVRMSHYPPDQHFLDVCDSLGMFVLDELTGWQAKYDTVIGKKLVKELVVRDVNHPSIVFWDNGNEGGWNTALDDQFRLYDPQDRQVIHPWEKFNGTDTRHYPDYNYVVNSALYGHDVFFPTEFMHGNYDGGAGAGLEDYWDLILKHPYGAGGFIWVFADGGIVRTDKDSVLDTAHDQAPDGILGPHREKEGSYYTIKELWSPIAIDRKRIPPDFNGKIAVENRYIYTNLDQCRFDWKLLHLPSPAEHMTQAMTGASATLPAFSLAPGEKGWLSLQLPVGWQQYDALYLTATDPHGREVFTWSWPLRGPEAMRKAIFGDTASAKPGRDGQDAGKPANAVWGIKAGPQDGSFVVASDGIRYYFDTTTGYLQKVVNRRSEISLSGGPVQTGVKHLLKEFKTYPAGDGFVVEPVYEGDTYLQIKWIFSPGRPVKLEYQYSYAKRWSQTAGVDFMGLDFNYPEEKITGMKWLGRGPYRVWKNRMKGQEFGVWYKSYNNTITGASWDYPEFKGYHADLYWVVVENKESPFTVYTDDPSVFLQMGRPEHSPDERASLRAAFPSGDIGFLTAISPIGTKFQMPDQLGPQSQKNIQLNYSPVKGSLWFDFR